MSTPSQITPLEGSSSVHLENNQNTNAKEKRPRKPMKARSAVWEHFTKFKNESGEQKSKCNYCGKEYFSDPRRNGTRMLWTHIENCTEHQHSKDTKQAQLSFKVGEDESSSSIRNWKFDQSNVRKALSYLVILDELPFKFVDGKGFKHFMSIACPHFFIPSRFTIQKDCYEIYREEKAILKKLLKDSCQRICLTTDTWTSIQRINYMCLTAHWIDNDWKLNKRILNFCPVSSHKGEELGRAVERCLIDWGIDKVLTITVDNASANDVMINYMKRRSNISGGSLLQGSLIHVRCIAHIINLVVNDGLKEMGASIDRVRDAVRYVRQSPSRLQKFKACIDIEKLEYKHSLCLDVCTRWNSTYLMLDAAQKYERAFERFSEQDPFYLSDLSKGDGAPMEDDWSNARRLCSFLGKFYNLTLKVSGSSYVTSNNFLHEINDVACDLIAWQNSDDLELQSMACRMKQKYDKYWGSWDRMNMIFYVAVILDPRYKFDYVDWFLVEIFKSDGIEKSQKVKDTLFAMYNEYKVLYGENDGSRVDISTNTNANEEGGGLRSRFKRMKAATGGFGEKSELEKYLDEEEGEMKDFNILEYWKINSSRFPILSKMARDVLAVPISTVPSESSFSTGGRVLDCFRSSLTPRMVQTLVCVEDWLQAKMKAKRLTLEEDMASLEELETTLNNISLEPTINEL